MCVCMSVYVCVCVCVCVTYGVYVCVYVCMHTKTCLRIHDYISRIEIRLLCTVDVAAGQVCKFEAEGCKQLRRMAFIRPALVV